MPLRSSEPTGRPFAPLCAHSRSNNAVPGSLICTFLVCGVNNETGSATRSCRRPRTGTPPPGGCMPEGSRGVNRYWRPDQQRRDRYRQRPEPSSGLTWRRLQRGLFENCAVVVTNRTFRPAVAQPAGRIEQRYPVTGLNTGKTLVHRTDPSLNIAVNPSLQRACVPQASSQALAAPAHVLLTQDRTYCSEPDSLLRIRVMASSSSSMSAARSTP